MPWVAPPNFTAGVLVTEANLDALSDDLTTGVLRPIAETTLGAPTASVTFSSIPATFRNLYLTILARGTNASTLVSVLCRFNADAAAANYHSEAIYATATTVASLEQAPGAMTGAFLGEIPAASSGSSIMYGGYEARVHDYQSAQEKIVLSTGDVRYGGAGSHRGYIAGGSWISATVITSITLLPSAGNFETYSKFTLYGEPYI